MSLVGMRFSGLGILLGLLLFELHRKATKGVW